MRDSSFVYPDEYIDYWGDVFIALDLAREGIGFEDFLKSPERFLRQIGVQPLLPAQLEAAAKGVDKILQSVS